MEPVEANNLMQTMQNCLKCSHLKLLSFVHKIVPCFLLVVQVLLSFATQPIIIALPTCKRKYSR